MLVRALVRFCLCLCLRVRCRRSFGGLLAQLAHGQELQDAVLHVLQAVVVLVEDLLRAQEVQLLLAALAPGQLADGLQVGADHLRLHGLAAQPGQALVLPLRFLAGVRGQLEVIELLAQLVQALAVILVAQLFLDGAQLLAQDDLALAVAELLLDLVLDLGLGVEDGDLALHMNQRPAQALLHGEGLQQLLGLRGGDVQVAGDQVGQLAGVLHSGKDLLHSLPGQARFLPQLRCALLDFTI